MSLYALDMSLNTKLPFKSLTVYPIALVLDILAYSFAVIFAIALICSFKALFCA